MKYETIGGQIKDTEAGKTVLRELRMGDRFTNKNREGLFEVVSDKCAWNGTAGSATRKVKNLKTGLYEHKLCRIAVIKL